MDPTTQRSQVLARLAALGTAKTNEIAAPLGLESQRVSAHLSNLRAQGYVEDIGETSNGHYMVKTWRITAKGRARHENPAPPPKKRVGRPGNALARDSQQSYEKSHAAHIKRERLLGITIPKDEIEAEP